MASCGAPMQLRQGAGRIQGGRGSRRRTGSARGKEGRGRGPLDMKEVLLARLARPWVGRTCLLCSQRPREGFARRQERSKQAVDVVAWSEPRGLRAAQQRQRPVGQAGARLDTLASPSTMLAGQSSQRAPLLDGTVDPQADRGAGEGSLGMQGEEWGAGGDKLWLAVQEEAQFSVEMLGGKRMVELVSAWDRLAPQLPPDIGRGAAAQVLLGALKLAVPALQGPCVAEGGRPRLLRALEIAKTLASLKMDAATLAAGVLVEAVEAGTLSLAAVEAELGPAVGRLLLDSGRVRAVPSRVDTYDDDTARALRQFCLAFHDVRAIVVELAARLETMRYLAWLPRYQQQLVALETLQIYAPMAHAIGTGSIMWELEDAAFRVLYPSAYASVEAWLRQHWQHSETILETACSDLDAALRGDPVMAECAEDWAISSRTKSLYSFMRKQLRDGRRHNEVYDLLGLRMIIKPVSGGGEAAEEARGAQACYRVQEVARQMWDDLPERYKDYIGRPKKNGYQSLHMLVQPSKRQGSPPVELQVRTERMDAAAVSGAASHGAYKGGLTDPQQVEQLRLIMEAASEMAASSFREAAGGTIEVVALEDTDHLFTMLDKNGDGLISHDELHQVMLELGADGHGDAAELLALLDENTDGSVSLEEFKEFRRRVAVLRELPGQDQRMQKQLTQAWGQEQGGEVAEASFRALEEEVEEMESEVPHEWGGDVLAAVALEAGGLSEDGEQGHRSFGKGGSFDLVRAGVQGGEDQRAVIFEPVGALPEAGLGARRASREGLRQQGGSVLAAGGGGAGLRALSTGAGLGSSVKVRSQAVGATPAGGGGGSAVVAARVGYDELVEELRQRGGRARRAVVDEEEFLVEKGSDLDRKLSHYEASSAPPNGAANQLEGHAKRGASNGSDGSSGGGPGNGRDHVLTRQELNRRLNGISEDSPTLVGGSPTEGRGEDGERRGVLVRALQRVEMKLGEGLFDEARTLLNVLVERHSADGRLWLHFGRLESRDPHGRGARKVYETARACLLQEAQQLASPGQEQSEQGRVVGELLVEVEAALAHMAPLQPTQAPAAPARRGQRHKRSPSEVLPPPDSRAARGPVLGETPLQRRVLGAGSERAAAPRSGAQLHQLALSFLKQGNAARARTLLQQGLQVAPRDVVLRLSLARLEADADNEAAARELFKQAATDAPANMLAWQSWAVFEARAGAFAEARRLFSRGVALAPRDLRLLQTWAKHEARRGCPEGKEKATQLYQRCVEIDRKSAEVWQAWGLMEAETGNVFGARRLFEACLHECPRDPGSLVAYARMERLYGALDAARSLLKRATYMEAHYEPAWLELPLLEKQAGNHTVAAELLERAKEARRMPKEARSVRGQSPADGAQGKGRHRKVARRKNTQANTSEGLSTLEGAPGMSFEASVQALTDSFKPTVPS